MKRKRAIGYILLIIANMLLLAYVFVPHHHNSQSHYIVGHPDCDLDDEIEHRSCNHTPSEECHLDLDLMVERFNTSLLFDSPANQLYFPILFKYQFQPQTNIVCYSLAPYLCIHYSPTIHPVFNLRGPPAIASLI